MHINKKILIFILFNYYFLFSFHIHNAHAFFNIYDEDISFFASENSNTLPCKSITIWSDETSWSVSDDAEWLEIFPTSGPDSDDISDINICVDNTSLEPGIHEAVITYTGESGDTRTGLVSLSISKVDVDFAESNSPAFSSPVIYTVPHYPIAHLVDDFNQDGNPDIAIVTNNGEMKEGKKLLPYFDGKTQKGNLIILLGDGNGKFKRIIKYKTGLNPVDMCKGDFNGDGITDLAVADAGKVKIINKKFADEDYFGDILSQDILIYYGQLSGKSVRFKTKKIESVNLPFRIQAADIDLDGKDDLLILEDSDNKAIFPTGDPPDETYDGAFKLSVFMSGKDGLERDINFPEGYGSNVLYDDDTGSLSEEIGLMVDDFDNDGNPDLLSTKNGKLYFLENQGDGSFSETNISLNNMTFKPRMIATGDFNNDDSNDIVTIGNLDIYDGLGMLAIGDGEGSFDISPTYSFLQGCYRISNYFNMKMFVADLNGDDYLDVVFPAIRSFVADDDTSCNDLINNHFKVLAVMLGDGNGDFSIPERIDVFKKKIEGMTPSAVTGGDFNKDGKMDLVVIGRNSRKVAVFLNR